MTDTNNFQLLQKLVKFRGASAMLFRNNKDEILIVKPIGKDYWNLPGGSAEKNETLSETAEREVSEEIGLRKKTGNLLLIVSFRQKMNDKIDEGILSIFDGGVLSNEETAKIKLQEDEIEDFKFVKKEELRKYLRDGSFLKKSIDEVSEAKKFGKTIYLDSKG